MHEEAFSVQTKCLQHIKNSLKPYPALATYSKMTALSSYYHILEILQKTRLLKRSNLLKLLEYIFKSIHVTIQKKKSLSFFGTQKPGHV